MSRFFKSAAFPILIVVVLAFFAQKLIGGPGSNTPTPSYGDFVAQLQAGQIKTVDVKTKDNTLVVKPRTGSKYETGFLPDNADRLESRLEAAKAQHQIDDFQIQGTKSNGWLSLLTYVLPFLIFIGFWIFLMNQVQGGGSKVMSFGKSRAKR
ncbi:MAG TPA: ATP-dependent metallopeptidase FtsH/Yme1/Tma family protein, partial [Solirubrobacteraceae bacterium]|nr:ATP-dependent metallopeptidase FtsH/Yme1/Tma family protein [Solirubrobacteraceae bacterium]